MIPVARETAFPQRKAEDQAVASSAPSAALEAEETGSTSGLAPASSLHPNERIAEVTARLLVAAQSGPDHAVYEAIRFCDEDPSYSFEYGQSLIGLLGKAGHYSAALRFILAEDAEGWLGENGSKWMTSLFTAWAKQSPLQALETVELSVPLGQRAEALQTVAAVWAQKDPVALADFIDRVPPDSEKRQLLEDTLLAWAVQ